jgi:protein-disulfide isomerase
MRLFPVLISVLSIAGCEPIPTAQTATNPDEASAETQAAITGVLTEAGLGSTAGTQAAVVAVTPYVSQIGKDEIPDDVVIAEWNGGTLTMGDLRSELAGELSQLEVQYVSSQRDAEITFLSTRYQMQSDIADSIATKAMLEAEAATLGYADMDALIEDKVISQVADPTEEQILEFYEAYKRQLRGAALEDVRPMIVDQIRQESVRAVIDVYIADLQERHGLKTSLPFPDLPRIPVETDGDPFLGSQDAPVEIVVFAEYQCPYCATVTPTLEQLIETYPDKLHVVFRDFPLDFHDRAIPAAIAANCAGEQDKYWEMHTLLMGNQRALSDDNFQAFGAQLGLDMASFNTCLLDPRQAAEIQADYEAGVNAGVGGTPSVYINGLKLTAGPSYEAMAEMIERELPEG